MRITNQITKPQKLALASLLMTMVTFCTTANQILPDVQLTDLRSGNTMTTQDLRGKVVYLDFWASWCVPCKKSFPFMNELYHQYPKEHFVILAINMDKSLNDAQQFLEAVPADFGVYVDTDNVLATALDLPGLPVAYLVNKNGEIKGRHIGFNDRKKPKKVKQLEYLLRQAYIPQ